MHALACGRAVALAGGCSSAAPGSAVVCALGRAGRAWRAEVGAGGCRTAAAREDADGRGTTFVVGCADGRVFVYRAMPLEEGGVGLTAVRALAGTSGGAVTRAVFAGGRLVAARGDGGETLEQWDGTTFERLDDAKGFGSGGERIGAASAYARLGTSDALVAVQYDRKALMCVSFEGARARLRWRSRREPGRGTFLAGATVIERGGVASSRAAVTCSCEEVIAGTTYAAPDSVIKIVVVDAEDGAELSRFPIEGLGASNNFIDCGSLCSVGSNLFLGLRDGSVWVINSGNGALVTSLHPPQEFVDTSGHRRTLPSLLAIAPARDVMYGAIADGGVINAWRVGIPTYWSRQTHKNFPRDFREQVRVLLMCARAAASPERAMRRLTMSAIGAANDVIGVDDGFENLRHVEGFLDLVLGEPALLEMIIARMARAQYGCAVVDAYV